MTKQEAIAATEYTESELIDLAFSIAKQECKRWRNEVVPEDFDSSEAWDHYDALYKAFEAMQEEFRNRKEN